MNIDGITLCPLVNELNSHIAGGRIDKIVQLNKDTLFFFIRIPKKNYILHLSTNSNHPILHLTNQTVDAPMNPPAFCMLLRKHLENGRIASIKQNNLDRLLSMDIDVIGTGGAIVTKTLVIELMGKYSNVILLQDNIIIDSLKKVTRQMNRFREILPNKPYIEPPKQNKINFIDASTDYFVECLLENPELPLHKAFMNVAMGIGPMIAKEFLNYSRLSIERYVKELTKKDLGKIHIAIDTIKNFILTNKIIPTLVQNEQNKIIALLPFPSQSSNNKQIAFPTLSELIDYTIRKETNYSLPEKEVLLKLIKHELSKLNNKLLILKDELKDANNSQTFKIKGDLLTTFQYTITADINAATINLPNIYSEFPDENLVQIEIDPTLSLIKNAQNYYRKYNKLKRAQLLLEDQVYQTQHTISYLESIDVSLISSQTLSELAEIKKELVAEGYIQEKKKSTKIYKPSSPLKIFLTEDTSIWIGKNNFQNDMVTFKIAQANDMWLHVKDHSGSHVIIHTNEKIINENTLLLAAKFAAYFSQACGSSKVSIDYTQRRYVKKPGKAKPGFVTYSNQKTIVVDSNKEEIEALLAKYSI